MIFSLLGPLSLLKIANFGTEYCLLIPSVSLKIIAKFGSEYCLLPRYLLLILAQVVLSIAYYLGISYKF